MTRGEIARAAKMRHEGHSVGEIAEFFNKSKKQIYASLSRRDGGGADHTPVNHRVDGRIEPPTAQALEERDRAYFSVPWTIGMTLLGDPLPGRSARDRRG